MNQLEISRKIRQRRGSRPNIEGDADSVENHTNLDWRTGAGQGKRRKEGQSEYTFIGSQAPSIVILGGQDSQPEEVSAQDFYESSHFFIDQLKDDACEVKENGWFEVKADAASQEEYPLSTNLDLSSKADRDQINEARKLRSGRWDSGEHQKFLEGLRLFGKDWPRITEFVGTRNSKAVMSHGQKFLIRLVNFLAHDGKPIQEVTQDEAEFYFGILQKRISWAAQMKAARDKEKEEMKRQGKIFYVQKVDRKLEKPKPDYPGRVDEEEKKQSSAHESAEKLTSFKAWRKSVRGDDKASSKSLGFSLKIKQSATLSFKADLIYEDEQSDNDSGTSQSEEHTVKFHLDEGLEHLLSNPEVIMAFQTKMKEQFSQIKDISSGERGVRLMLKMLPDGPIFDIFKEHPPSDIIEILYKQQDCNFFAKSHPNLDASFWREMTTLLHERGLMDSREPTSSLKSYFKSLNEETTKTLLENGFQIYLERPSQAGGADLSKKMDQFSLDMATNFAHQS